MTPFTYERAPSIVAAVTSGARHDSDGTWEPGVDFFAGGHGPAPADARGAAEPGPHRGRQARCPGWIGSRTAPAPCGSGLSSG